MGKERDIKIVRSRKILRPFAMVYGPCVRDRRISDAAFRTLILADLLCGADGEGSHSMRLVGRLRGTDERTIRRHWAELKEAGLIQIEYRGGFTNVITLVDPAEVYGAEAISGFYAEVRQISAALRSEPEGDAEGPEEGEEGDPGQTCPPSPDINCTPPRTNLSPRIDKGEQIKDEQSPSERALSGDAERGAASGGVKSSESKAPISKRAGSGINTGEAPREQPEGGLGRRPKADPDRHRRAKSFFDPNLPDAQWDARQVLGYFRETFRKTWPMEPPPDLVVSDLAPIKKRVDWLLESKQPVILMKQVIDHIFTAWDKGLRERLGWSGTRPSVSLIMSAKYLDTLIREVQNGAGPAKGGRRDEWDPASADRSPKTGWGSV